MINYILEPNELTREPNKYRAQVVNSRSYSFDDIAEHLLEHHTGVSSAVIYGVWEGIKGAVKEYIASGAAVNTELFRAHASIQGVFDGIDDRFDKSRHKIRLNLRPGQLLTDAQDGLKVKKTNSADKIYIKSVIDIKTGSVNQNLTPGKNIRIIGKRLKIEGDNPTCGLYFIPEKNTFSPIMVDASEFVVNNPSEIIAVIPKLGKGVWNLRLVTQYCRSNRSLKEPQNVIFGKRLVVA